MTEHSELDDDEREQIRDRLKQERMIESAFINGDGPWTVVYDDWHLDNDNNGGRYMAFAQPRMRDKILSDAGWDFTRGDGIPGFSTSGDEISYMRSNKLPDFEPLIIFHQFHGVVPDAWIVSEEFRLLMNLWQDPKSGNYYEVKNDGSKNLAIRFQEERIEVRTPILKRYMAARQLDAVLFVDSVTFIPCNDNSTKFSDLEFEHYSNIDLLFEAYSQG